MRAQEDLQVAIRERFRRLMTAHYEDFSHQIDLTTAWIEKQPALASILVAAEQVEPELDFDGWLAMLTNRRMSWPASTEEGKATLVWRLMKYIGSDEINTQNWRMILFTFSGKLSEAPREMSERLLAALFDFLTERVGMDSNILHVLNRYVRKVEWFDREALHAEYLAQTRRGEEVYDRHLRRFLFSEGINMPFSQAKSASGLSDVLTDLDTEDPLVCELKLFDADNHGKRVIAAGLNQVTHYAGDYNKTVAYLVIVNLSGRALELPTDGEAKVWPRYIELGGVRTYLIPVRALPPEASASKLGKASPVSVSREELVNPDMT
ncbi:hypothetical protein C8D87_115127 [Lentzea atacamensis]|uniref:DUF3883 domain-containing protein n=1 Tax=Lentzea atacamensis TaxID=531938 RepID=A0ABX9DYV5_9PSEU|nr:hypothetical protein [Lentzea atacamensis]RAS59266.1 hypothetical protein C8D87_115127 [Lentzea atacamensis]